MRCSNEKCRRQFAEPLELFNGVTACPYCKTEQKRKNFELTKQNQELFDLSELYFYRYLFPSSLDKKAGGRIILKKSDLLKEAMENCKRSAYLGNIFASYKMGGYYERYNPESQSEFFRIKTAFEYYADVCFFTKDVIPTEKGARAVKEADVKELKRIAATDLLNLIVKHGSLLKGDEKFDPEKTEKRIFDVYGIRSVGEDNNRGGVNKVNAVYNTVCSCIVGKRPPLFGLFFMTGREIKDLFDIKADKTKKRKFDFINVIARGVEIRYIPCRENGDIDDGFYNEMMNFPYNAERINDLLDGLDDYKHYYLYFFNTGGKHRYLTDRQAETIRAEFNDMENNCYLLDKLIRHERLEYLFFDDDIMFVKGKKIKGSAELLVNMLWGE